MYQVGVNIGSSTAKVSMIEDEYFIERLSLTLNVPVKSHPLERFAGAIGAALLAERGLLIPFHLKSSQRYVKKQKNLLNLLAVT